MGLRASVAPDITRSSRIEVNFAFSKSRHQ
jgi:hypothetical protein